MGQRPLTPEEQALAAGLSTIKDPIEKRNMRYAEAERMFNETGDPEYKKYMAEENPYPGLNAAWGGIYGALEGVATPWVIRDILRMKDPGVPTTGNTAARIGGNLVGGIAGLGKATAMLGGIKAAPKAVSALYGMSGLGQAAGGRSETEAQKTSQREFMTGSGREIPSYMEATPLNSVPAVANLTGQALMSALSGNLGQKALRANRVATLPSTLSTLAEGGVSTGLALNDANRGELGKAYNDNPDAYHKMGGMVAGMSMAGAAAPFGANALMRRPKSQAQATFEGAPPPAVSHTSPSQDFPLDPGKSFEFGRMNLPPEVMAGLRLMNMHGISGRPADRADQALGHSLLDTSRGRFMGQDGEELLELIARIGEEEHMAIGSDPLKGGFITRNPKTDQYGETTERALHNPMSLYFQPAQGGGSVPMPKGAIPLSSPKKVTYPGPDGAPTEGWAIAKHPDGMIIQTDQGARLIQNTSLLNPPESNAAKAVQKKVPSNTPGRVSPIPTAPQDYRNMMTELQNNMMNLRKLMAEAGLDEPVASHEPTQQPMFDSPTLPFDLSDITGAQQWKPTDWFSTKKQ